jgi:hypothetical protein
MSSYTKFPTTETAETTKATEELSRYLREKYGTDWNTGIDYWEAAVHMTERAFAAEERINPYEMLWNAYYYVLRSRKEYERDTLWVIRNAINAYTVSVHIVAANKPVLR